MDDKQKLSEYIEQIHSLFKEENAGFVLVLFGCILGNVNKAIADKLSVKEARIILERFRDDLLEDFNETVAFKCIQCELYFDEEPEYNGACGCCYEQEANDSHDMAWDKYYKSPQWFLDYEAKRGEG